ncbi:WXG100 family type VII secretion target [Mycolicibacterium mageritense]|uniref:WXG100 family type VII secretion target n=1 Tax=Mycolicibacterium mageritense TaxID=53462 RepID=UPI0011DB69DE|nr:WXG100 family type VII secretion target [Mycolicibacterium mageritense]TXI53372.1 MAG: WXG100 family type VII secretion target [Mycolicibacterium mageritense]
MSLRVSPTELEQHAAFADTLAEQLIDQHLKLATQMADLLDGNWKGTAAAACQKAWQEWNDGFRLMIQGLNDEAQALRLAANAYRRTDEGGASRVNSIEL